MQIKFIKSVFPIALAYALFIAQLAEHVATMQNTPMHKIYPLFRSSFFNNKYMKKTPIRITRDSFINIEPSSVTTAAIA